MADGSGQQADTVARAAALVPALAARAATAVTERRVPAASMAAVRAAGLMRHWQPARWGGAETDIATLLAALTEVARGCTATAWVMGVWHAHSWLMALFPEAAQRDVWGDSADRTLAGVPTPRGAARIVAGGYLLSGRWPFASGIDHADWILLGATIDDAAGSETIFVVPRDDVTSLDDWNTAGLAGTGSHTVTATDLFVPAHRALRMASAMSGKAPGLDANRGPLYRAPLVPVLGIAVTGAPLGAAEAAWQAFAARLPGRGPGAVDGVRPVDQAAYHMLLAETRTRLDAARMVLERAAADLDRHIAAGAAMPPALRARQRVDCAWAVGECAAVAARLHALSGASTIALGNIMQRAAADTGAASMHAFLELPGTLEIYGRTLLGLDTGTAFI
ncbi:MAG: acyl-CoA dehydrogenase family protein [Alphaproteobacteria bacterium]